MSQLFYWLRVGLAFTLSVLIATLWALPALCKPRDPMWLTRVARSVRGLNQRLLGLQVSLETESPDAMSDGQQGVIYAANHQHRMDVLILMLSLPPRAVVLCKHQVLLVPLLGQLLWLFGCLFVHRRHADDRQRVLQQMREFLLRRNASLWLFPEGSRDPAPATQPFHSGSFTLARKAGITVVPVAVEAYVGRIPSGRLTPRRIRVKMLAPMQGDDYADGEAFAAACRAAIDAQVTSWQ